MKEKRYVQKVILAGVIIADNKILILKRSDNEDAYPGVWELPSGKRERFEPSQFSLIREVREETGLSVEIIMPFAVFDYQIEKEDEIRDSTQINYLVKVKYDSGKVELSKEHGDYAWVSENELNKYDITDNTKGVLRKAFRLSRSLSI